MFCSYAGPTSVCAHDVDDDGDLDVVSTSYNDDTLAWYESDLASIVRHRETDPGRCGPLFADTKCTGYSSSGGAEYCNEANGWCGVTDAHRDAQASTTYDYVPGVSEAQSWTLHTLTTSRNWAWLARPVDMDGDGHADVLLASWGDDTVSWW